MAQSLAKLLVHLVYSTKHRARRLPHQPYRELHAFCGGVLKNHKCHLVEMNNVEDHVHALLDLHRTEALSDIVRELKTSSTKWLKEQSPVYNDFEWQDGFVHSRWACRRSRGPLVTCGGNRRSMMPFLIRTSFAGSLTPMRWNTTSDMFGIDPAPVALFQSAEDRRVSAPRS